MRKMIFFAALAAVMALASVTCVFADGDTPSLTCTYDDSFGSGEQGKLAVSVVNNTEDSFESVKITVTVPDGVVIQTPSVDIGNLTDGEIVSHDFVLDFEKVSFVQRYFPFILLGASVFVFLFAAAAVITVKTKKGRGGPSLVVCALLISVTLSVSSYAADSGNISDTVTVKHVKRSCEITVSAEFTKAQPAESHPLKNDLPSQSGAEYNRRMVAKSRIKEGAGPLTSHNVYIGKNDFMFMGETFPDSECTNLFNEHTLKRIASLAEKRREWAEENGKKFYILVCPDKATVYWDYLPSGLERAETTRLDQFISYMSENSEVPVIDVREELTAAREEYGDELYYNYDTHWNSNGAFVAYTKMMKRIQEDFPSAVLYRKNDFNVKYYETYMKDMPYYLGYYDSYYDEGPVYSLKFGPAAVLTEKESDGNYGQYIFCEEWEDGYRDNLIHMKFKSKNESAPSLYMMRDSYAVSLVPFLKESFSESSFDWTYDFSCDEILDSGADVVVFEIVEKALDNLAKGRALS